MKKLSIWAARQPKSARLFIFLLQSILITCGIIIGTLLYKGGLILNQNLIYVIAALLSGAILLYPLKKDMFKLFYFKGTYIRQKILDGTLALCIFLATILGTNQLYSGTLYFQSSSIISKVYAVDVESYKLKDQVPETNKKKNKSLSDKRLKRLENKLSKISQKKKTRSFKFFTKRNSKDKLTGKQLLSIFLSIFLGLILLVALGAASCAISCNGATGIAVIVFIGGLVGIIFLVAYLIRNIKKVPKEG